MFKTAFLPDEWQGRMAFLQKNLTSCLETGTGTSFDNLLASNRGNHAESSAEGPSSQITMCFMVVGYLSVTSGLRAGFFYVFRPVASFLFTEEDLQDPRPFFDRNFPESARLEFVAKRMENDQSPR